MQTSFSRADLRETPKNEPVGRAAGLGRGLEPCGDGASGVGQRTRGGVDLEVAGKVVADLSPGWALWGWCVGVDGGDDEGTNERRIGEGQCWDRGSH